MQVTAGLRDMRDRIGSVKNTQKITEAMKLVAAAKVRRAQEAVINSRPFTENLVKVSVVQLMPVSQQRPERWALGLPCSRPSRRGCRGVPSLQHSFPGFPACSLRPWPRHWGGARVCRSCMA